MLLGLAAEFLHLRRKSDQPLRRGSDILQRGDSLSLHATRRFPDEVSHQGIQHLFQGFIRQQVLWCSGELTLYHQQRFMEDAYVPAEHFRMEHPGFHAVVHVGRQIGDLIRQIDQLRFQRRLLIQKITSQLGVLCGRVAARVLDDAFADAQGEVQPAKPGIANLEILDHAQRVQVVIAALAKFLQTLIQRPLTGMPEGRVPDVMHQRQRFGHVLVQLERGGDGARDLRHLHSVGEAAAKVIGITVSKDLCFSRQAAKGSGMDDPGAITLERSSIGMGSFGVLSLGQQETGVVRYGNARRQGKNLAPYCFGLAPVDSSLASLTRALSSFFCTLFTSLGSASAGTVRAYSERLCSHCAAANFRRPVFSYSSPRWSCTAGSCPMRSLALRRLASAKAYWPILKYTHPSESRYA